MKGDFTRDTFDAAKHYSRVLMQQGRVTLDADHNEQTAILLHYLRTLARDLIGPYAAPVEHPGFILSSDASGELMIGAGRYYVDGILVENDMETPYSSQPDYPLPVLPAVDPLSLPVDKRGSTVYWVYLDVWEWHITALSDDDIREDALNGPDTCTRAKVVWQVKAHDVTDPAHVNDPGAACETPLTGLVDISAASLSARIDPGKKIENVCITPPSSKYRGENQLYRVEIHQGGIAGTPGATFKWSRENGSVVTAWLGVSGNELLVAHSRGFCAGDWVELNDDTGELQGLPGILVNLTKVESGKLTVDLATVPPADPLHFRTSSLAIEHLVNPKVRRWDQKENEQTHLQSGAVAIQERGANPLWLDLEDGVQVQFEANGAYRPGDYWLIPARVASADVEWPLIPNPDKTSPVKNIPEPLPPDGIEHHYAPLGFVAWPDKKFQKHTCRCDFEPLSSCFSLGSAAVGLMLLQHPPADTRLSPAAGGRPQPKRGGTRKRNP